MEEQKTHEFYANAINIVTSMYDVTLNFRTQSPVQIDEETGEAVMEVTQLSNIRMSPQHAKSLAVLLLRHLCKYEHEHDLTLPVPDHLQKIWDTIVSKPDDWDAFEESLKE